MTLAAEGVTVAGRLFDVTLALAPGRLVCVVGENGAGKTTLLDVLAGVARPDRGRILLEGKLLEGLAPRERARRVASLGQETVDYDATVAERIAQGLAPRRGSAALLDDDARAQVHKVAEELAVERHLERDLLTLSSGERRRVDVARALVDDEVGCILVDEPHAGVDVRHQSLVSAALARRARAGKIVVASVHDLAVAATLADRLLGLKDGRVVVDGPPSTELSTESIEALYGVAGARVVRDGGDVAVLLPRGQA